MKKWITEDGIPFNASRKDTQQNNNTSLSGSVVWKAKNTKNKITVFLSHCHKDIEIVRKIRDVLETLNCDPITFFLACMNDNSTELENLIHREIDARDVFVYCKSQRSEESSWVKKELQHIKNSEKRRFYVIDLEQDFEISLVSLLDKLVQMIRRNTIVLCTTQAGKTFANKLKRELKKRGFSVILLEAEEQKSYVQTNDCPKGRNLEQQVQHYCTNAIVIPIIYPTEDRENQEYVAMEELLWHIEQQKEAMYLPIAIIPEWYQDCLPTQNRHFKVSQQEFECFIPNIVDQLVELAARGSDFAELKEKDI